jgi:hypothetical protein
LISPELSGRGVKISPAYFLRCVADVCAALQRMAVYEACSLLRKYDKEYKALQEAMRRGANIAECVRAIEEA